MLVHSFVPLFMYIWCRMLSLNMWLQMLLWQNMLFLMYNFIYLWCLVNQYIRYCVYTHIISHVAVSSHTSWYASCFVSFVHMLYYSNHFLCASFILYLLLIYMLRSICDFIHYCNNACPLRIVTPNIDFNQHINKVNKFILYNQLKLLLVFSSNFMPYG